jgi:hypothetical protein
VRIPPLELVTLDAAQGAFIVTGSSRGAIRRFEEARH